MTSLQYTQYIKSDYTAGTWAAMLNETKMKSIIVFGMSVFL